MEDVILFIEDRDSKKILYRCRICYEEEAETESYFEAPCSCSGSLKFAHRDCIQRWCDEKGNTICEICLQEYKPEYTITSKPYRFNQEAITIGDDLEENRGTRINRRRLVNTRDESDFEEYNYDANRGASCCKYLAFIFSVVLLIKHAFDVVYGTDEYPFTIFTVITLKAIGILLPMIVIIRTIAAIQNSLRRQFLESEEDTLSFGEEYDVSEEEEQQQHLA